jgi:hypothetical protein
MHLLPSLSRSSSSSSATTIVNALVLTAPHLLNRTATATSEELVRLRFNVDHSQMFCALLEK